MKRDLSAHPTAILGAGPVGLAAAAHLAARGLPFLVFESGARIAEHFESTRHVALFSPWRYNIDKAARALLTAEGWLEPELDKLPTCGEVIDEYLRPLSQLPAIAPFVRLEHRVVHVARAGFDKLKTAGREHAPFLIRVTTADGTRDVLASAVIDATGTWSTPNPLGANGLPAEGEREHAAHFAYGMPDVLGTQRARYAGKRVLVAGAGHSAIGTLIALTKLAEEAQGTEVHWALRGHNFERILGGGSNDGLPARGALGARVKNLRDTGRLHVHADFKISAVRSGAHGFTIEGMKNESARYAVHDIEEVIVATGARPDFSLASELRVKLDPWIESTEALAPLIDPNVHSCGTVRPHGHRELAHPEKGYYALGAKSYGRATNFLMATGFEQARSVVAAIAGDMAAADDVQLELPETGVCSTQWSEDSSACCTKAAKVEPAPKSSCCGGPPVKRADACCVKDEVAKDSGASGCGCGPAKTRETGEKASTL
ncbi:NAD(P)-binding domain-containing protein [Usitatibacter palustris]|uniref:Flavoprotein n=1 Tax=Usitatibacter palustris TaxID=2732487 RepID=A0A6M4H8N7_9PROT|nr:NAD(P)-binding domain-containing protein [Usitatibacter palustris]QJR16089.1 hypothetical protein DSM104440_02918 [Usitatibacter palustris]